VTTSSSTEESEDTISFSESQASTLACVSDSSSMQSGRTSGGVSNMTSTTISTPSTRLRSDRAYLLIGGGGGIGLSIARWLVENGARSLIFFSRNGGRALTADLKEEFQAMGATAIAVDGCVENSEDCARAVEAADYPVGGVVHAAMVLNVSISSALHQHKVC
jgi:hypothetical protein